MQTTDWKDPSYRPLTKVEAAKLEKLSKKILANKATRSEIGTAFSLKLRKNKAGVEIT